MKDNRAVICGMGAVSVYGAGVDCLWENALAGNCGLRELTRFDCAGLRSNMGGEVPQTESGAYGENLVTGFAVAAAREAAGDAQFSGGSLGIILGSNFQGISVLQQQISNFTADHPDAVNLDGYRGEALLRAVREAVGGAGPQQMLSLACASGTAVLGVALEWLRTGWCEAVLAGGVDELSLSALAGLSNLRAITSGSSVMPFDRERGGTLFSEGAGMFLVRKNAEHGYAEVCGRGLNNDAFHMTAPEKEGRGITRCMEMALTDAGLKPEQIDHFNAHGTATKYNDMIETAALHTVFGERARQIPVTANKSLFGHGMGAAGALEAIIACRCLKEQVVVPTLHCNNPDPDLEINLVRDTAQRCKMDYVMSNSYGLGGANASVILRRV